VDRERTAGIAPIGAYPADRPPDFLKRMIITIDGPAGSGKSTTASMLAKRLGLTYLDTGAMYRAVTLAALERGVDPADDISVTRAAEAAAFEFRKQGNAIIVYVDGRNVERDIRGPAVSDAVSHVSRHEGVRHAMVRLQRRLGCTGGIVAEGRDTGSVVFPFAAVRVFLTADVEARAERRGAQLREIGVVQHIGDIRRNLIRRDEIDSQRRASPLVRPAGAFALDTTRLSIDEQVTRIEREVRAEEKRLSALAVEADEDDPLSRMRRYYALSHACVRGLMRGLFGLEIHGSEHLRFRENYIFASNHISYADPPIVGCTLNREVWFLAKKELFRNRLFARLISSYHAIPVDRDELERTTVKRIFAILGEKGSILMFPEGTRSRTGELGELKPGLGYVAVISGATVVPVYVSGTNDLGRCLLRRQKLQVRIGPPIRIRPDRVQEDRKEEYRILTRMVASELRMLQDEAKD
jgi:cytidylate kinase